MDSDVITTALGLTCGGFLWLTLGVAGYVLGARKGMGGLGFILGMILGPIGLLVIAMLQGDSRVPHLKPVGHNLRKSSTWGPGGTRPCPACGEQISPSVDVCPMCRGRIRRGP
jgi:hypothetical protein